MFVRVEVVNNGGQVLHQAIFPANGLAQWEAPPGLPLVGDGQTIGRITLDARPGHTLNPPSIEDLARDLAMKAARDPDDDDDDDEDEDSVLDDPPVETDRAPLPRWPALRAKWLHRAHHDAGAAPPADDELPTPLIAPVIDADAGEEPPMPF